MKTSLFTVLSLLASVAAVAGGIDAKEQIFGYLPITTSNQSVIVSVPWIAPGYDTDAAITVSNLIRTAELTVGDQLKAYDAVNQRFNVWTLEQDASTQVKYWASVAVAQANVNPVASASADAATVARGDALILTRNASSSEAGKWVEGQNYTFYVCGQVGTSKVISVTMAQGSAETPAYTLIAPPYAADADLNADATWSNVPAGDAAGDLIYIGDGSESLGSYVYYKKKKGKWGCQHAAWENAPKIKAGVGCWYVSRVAGSAVTLEWASK